MTPPKTPMEEKEEKKVSKAEKEFMRHADWLNKLYDKITYGRKKNE